MGARWIHMSTAIRHWLGQHLSRAWHRTERLYLSVDRLPAAPHYELGHRPIGGENPGDVVPLLGRDNGAERGDSEDRGPRPVDGEGAGARSVAWSVAGGSATGYAVIASPAAARYGTSVDVVGRME